MSAHLRKDAQTHLLWEKSFWNRHRCSNPPKFSQMLNFPSKSLKIKQIERSDRPIVKIKDLEGFNTVRLPCARARVSCAFLTTKYFLKNLFQQFWWFWRIVGEKIPGKPMWGEARRVRGAASRTQVLRVKIWDFVRLDLARVGPVSGVPAQILSIKHSNTSYSLVSRRKNSTPR